MADVRPYVRTVGTMVPHAAPPSAAAASATVACPPTVAGPAKAACPPTVACSRPIAEIADAARSKWWSGMLQTIHIDYLGVAPWNRGRLGVSSYHVQDVVVSIRDDGFSRQRYRDVTVVRVPDEQLGPFRAFNKELLEADPSLPPFSDQMRYACMTKRLGCA